MHISIIIPAYNEEKRIAQTLSKISDFLKTKDYTYEVILVDDGSSDNTIQESKRSTLFKEGKLSVIENQINKGKGFSVRRGIMASTGDYILFTDADLSTPVKELDKLFNYINNGYDITIGSRSVQHSNVRVHQPWYRERMGKIFNFFVKLLVMKEFNDTQCGFKLFKGNIARDIVQHLKIDGFCFDVEMIYSAKVDGYKIKEIGVIWENSPQSKVRMINSSLSMFLDLLKIKALHR